MSDHDLVFLAMITLVSDQLAVLVSHFQAIDHHESSDLGIETAAAHFQQVLHMCVLKIQLTVQLVVFLVESAASDKNANSHKPLLNT